MFLILRLRWSTSCIIIDLFHSQLSRSDSVVFFANLFWVEYYTCIFLTSRIAWLLFVPYIYWHHIFPLDRTGAKEINKRNPYNFRWSWGAKFWHSPRLLRILFPLVSRVTVYTLGTDRNVLMQDSTDWVGVPDLTVCIVFTHSCRLWSRDPLPKHQRILSLTYLSVILSLASFLEQLCPHRDNTNYVLTFGGQRSCPPENTRS